jgi:6-phosphofructokinase
MLHSVKETECYWKRGGDKIKVGILSGGGDAPGINAVLRAVVRKAIQDYGYETVGIKDGWRGLIEGEFIPLDLKTLATLKNSSQVAGGWSLLSANSFLLYHKTFARWMLTGTPQ